MRIFAEISTKLQDRAPDYGKKKNEGDLVPSLR